ncbi:hypothetical protein GCM10010505_34040 [Kitasatospora aburaviensis]
MSTALTTDLYEVRMAHSLLLEGTTGPTTFRLFVRGLPPDRGFLVVAGLEPALDYLTGVCVDEEDPAAFATALGRPRADLEPLLPEAQLVESYLPDRVCHQTTVASKAALCVLAAARRPVVDFSLAPGHGRLRATAPVLRRCPAAHRGTSVRRSRAIRPTRGTEPASPQGDGG